MIQSEIKSQTKTNKTNKNNKTNKQTTSQNTANKKYKHLLLLLLLLLLLQHTLIWDPFSALLRLLIARLRSAGNTEFNYFGEHSKRIIQFILPPGSVSLSLCDSFCVCVSVWFCFMSLSVPTKVAASQVRVAVPPSPHPVRYSSA